MIDPDSELEPRYQSVIAPPDWYQTNIPCQVGCPAHTDVATYIGLISQARFDEAYLLNRKANVVPGVLGRTCARPCEPVCRRNKIDGKPSGFNHFGFGVEDNEEIIRRFEEKGYRPPLKRPGDRLYAEYRAIDPDGNNFDISVNGYEKLRPDRDMTKKVQTETV